MTDLETLRRDCVMERLLDAMKAAGVPTEPWEYLEYCGLWVRGAEVSRCQPESGPTEYCYDHDASDATLPDLDAAAFACVRWMVNEGREPMFDIMNTDEDEGPHFLILGCPEDGFGGPTPYHTVLHAMETIGAKP